MRVPSQALIARLRSECDFYIAHFFRGRGFVRVQPPILTSSDCEGAGEVFTVSSESGSTESSKASNAQPPQEDAFFGQPKYLTVSSQLHLEAFVHEHQKVWSLSPTFRAEKSDTHRHVSEFWMLEAEFQTETLEEVMSLVEDLIKSIMDSLRGSKIKKELMASMVVSDSAMTETPAEMTNALSRRWDRLADSSWPRISYGKAINILESAVRNNAVRFDHQPSWQAGLQLEHERYLAMQVGQGGPVFVTDYPKAIKAFYMLPTQPEPVDDNNVLHTAACFDLLLPEVCETVGGSLREHRLPRLRQSMQRHGLCNSPQNLETEVGNSDTSRIPDRPENLNWYVDLRRYGSVPHGGFGLGFDRLLCYLTGVRNIRDVIPWPRYYGRCDG